jgi:large subunit ribosomal protein L25
MANLYELNAELRETAGRGASRLLRRENRIPAIVYGAEKPAQNISLNHFEMSKALENDGIYSHILTVNINGEKQQAVLKAIQRHPYKPKIEHIDFLRINPKEKIVMHVPIHFKGELDAPGIKEGGVFMHLMNSIEIRCLPSNLPESVEIDVSGFNIDESISLSDLKLPKDVELMAFAHGGDKEEHDALVVKLHIPRVEVEEEVAPVVAEGEVPVEGEEGAPAAEGAPATAAAPADAAKKEPAKDAHAGKDHGKDHKDHPEKK